MDERSRRISEAIEKSGLSYPELEKITGVSKSSLQRYATGVTKKIPIDCIEKIAEATGFDARYLMCWEDSDTKKDPHSPQDTDAEIEDERWEQLRRTLQAMPDECVDEVLSYAEYMKKKSEEK